MVTVNCWLGMIYNHLRLGPPGMSMGGYLDCVSCSGKTLPLWVAPFPSHLGLYKWRKGAEQQQTFIPSSLFLIVDTISKHLEQECSCWKSYWPLDHGTSNPDTLMFQFQNTEFSEGPKVERWGLLMKSLSNIFLEQSYFECVWSVNIQLTNVLRVWNWSEAHTSQAVCVSSILWGCRDLVRGECLGVQFWYW